MLTSSRMLKRTSAFNMKYLVVSHDAGGADVVSSFVEENPHKDVFVFCLEGPAVGVFGKRGLGSPSASGHDPCAALEQVQPDAVLCASSWASPLELNFLIEAKKKSIRTIVYLDHWINYRERFGYPRPGWKDNLPDEIWVGDIDAKKKAKAQFPNVPIHVEPNRVFAGMRQAYQQYVSLHPDIAEDTVIFMSEPVSASINVFGDASRVSVTEYDILSQLFDALVALRYHGSVVIRFHPSESEDKYDFVINKYEKSFVIEKSRRRELFADLAKAWVVIGMESMVLVHSLLCGKRTISFFPDTIATCSLPVEGIEKVRDASSLRSLLSGIMAAG